VTRALLKNFPSFLKLECGFRSAIKSLYLKSKIKINFSFYLSLIEFMDGGKMIKSKRKKRKKRSPKYEKMCGKGRK
jgi:hypothetical protein